MQKQPAATQAALRALGETIRAERQRLRISQEKLAELADVHANYIGRVERAEINLSFDTMHRIAGALRLTLHELMKRANV